MYVYKNTPHPSTPDIGMGCDMVRLRYDFLPYMVKRLRNRVEQFFFRKLNTFSKGLSKRRTKHFPSKRIKLFQRLSNAICILWTSEGRRFDVLCHK